MFAFTYREKQVDEGIDKEVVENVEKTIINSFLGVTLRLSLEDFRPILYKLMNVHFLSRNANSLTTLFSIVGSVAGRLKSLFSFALEMLITQTSSVLQTGQDKPPELLHACLSGLSTAFTYNKVEGITNKQYEELVSVLLSIYNCVDPPMEELEKCLVQLASATEDDTDWKHLNYQVLLSLRAGRADVRLAVLSVLEKLVTARADAYLAVLPDAVPFMMELLEDDDQVVENKCRDLIKHMETTFGQNIESYFV